VLIVEIDFVESLPTGPVAKLVITSMDGDTEKIFVRLNKCINVLVQLDFLLREFTSLCLRKSLI